MEEVAGWVTFKTKIDDKYFEKQYNKAKRDLEKLEKDQEKLTDKKQEVEVKYKIDKEAIEKEFEEEQKKLLDDARKTLSGLEINYGKEHEFYKDSVKYYDEKQDQLIAQYNNRLDEASTKWNAINSKIDANKQKQEVVKQQIGDITNKYNEWKKSQPKEPGKEFDFSGASISLDKVGKKMNGIIKKVGRWATALIGIRSIYGLLSNAAARLDQTNKQTKKDLEYMKTALATGLEPIITWLVNMAMRLLQIFNTLVYKLTGKNLFKDAKKNLESGAKSAKSINKSLAGFDEMNVLSDNSSGGGAGGGVAPSLDLGKTIDFGDLWENLKAQLEDIWNKFIRWLEDTNWQEAGMNLYLHIKKWFTDIKWGDVIANLVEGIGAVFGAVGAAIGGFFAGVWLDIKEYFADWIEKSREQGGNIIDGLLAGILNAIAQIGIWIYEHILKPFIDGFKKAFGINSPSKVMIEMGGFLIDGLKEGLKNIWNKVKEIFENLKTKIVNVFTSIKEKITEVWKTVKNYIIDKVITPISKKFDDFKDKISKIINGIKETAVKVINKIIEAMNKLIKGLNKISFDVPDWVPAIGGKKWGFNLKEIPTVKLQKGGIINMPGKGVPIGGEAGAEGVIPMTDAEQMALLGEAIGKYITINLTNITKLDSREISRTNEEVKSNRDFIMNR